MADAARGQFTGRVGENQELRGSEEGDSQKVVIYRNHRCYFVFAPSFFFVRFKCLFAFHLLQ